MGLVKYLHLNDLQNLVFTCKIKKKKAMSANQYSLRFWWCSQSHTGSKQIVDVIGERWSFAKQHLDFIWCACHMYDLFLDAP